VRILVALVLAFVLVQTFSSYEDATTPPTTGPAPWRRKP
jgi:hypothetical protein